MPRCWLFALLAACSAPTPAVRDLDGAVATPLAVPAGDVHVLVFVSQECPIANAYAPEFRALAAGWKHAPVHLFFVHVDPDLTVDAARAHAREYELPGTVLLDPRHALAAAVGATRTPEAAVVTAAGLQYRGRIDDQWGDLGRRAGEANRHDLRDAVAAVLAGRPVATPRTPTVGCLLPEPRATH